MPPPQKKKVWSTWKFQDQTELQLLLLFAYYTIFIFDWSYWVFEWTETGLKISGEQSFHSPIISLDSFSGECFIGCKFQANGIYNRSFVVQLRLVSGFRSFWTHALCPISHHGPLSPGAFFSKLVFVCSQTLLFVFS